MMLLAIIAPELIVFFAVRQYFFARAFSKSEFHRSQIASPALIQS
jgi:hypothetical protein